MPVQQGALEKAAGTQRAGEDRQGEVGKSVPQQGTEGGLRQLAHCTAQRLDTNMSQQVLSHSLRDRQRKGRKRLRGMHCTLYLETHSQINKSGRKYKKKTTGCHFNENVIVQVVCLAASGSNLEDSRVRVPSSDNNLEIFI